MSQFSRRLTAEDAIFLNLERKEMPLHIGSVSIVEGTVPFETVIENMRRKLHLLPRYRQIVVSPPFNVGQPTWEDDPDFQIERHLFHHKLDPPGSEDQLKALAGRVFTPLMDRRKPLWDIHIVDGLEGGRSALVSRVHHALADGVSGVGILNVLLDESPEPALPKAVAFHPQPLPDPLRLYLDALTSAPLELVDRLVGAQKALLDISQSLFDQRVWNSALALPQLLAELLYPVERLPFNRVCSGQRLMSWTEHSFAEVHAIRDAAGSKINDVALTVLVGALSRYAQFHGEGVKRRFARIMMPVNVRREDQYGKLGNRVSVIPMNLPMDVADPMERLRVVTRRTEIMKTARVADWISLGGAWLGAMPAAAQVIAGAIPYYAGPAPIFNMVCTNVPGPQYPLYVAGRKILTYYPHVPIGVDMGMGSAIQSYNGRMYFGFTADAAAGPDVERLREFVDESFAELRKAAGVPAMEKPAEAPKRRRAAARRKAAPATAAPAAEAVKEQTTEAGKPAEAEKLVKKATV